MLGHASTAMTLSAYVALFYDDLDAVSETWVTARSSAVVGKPCRTTCKTPGISMISGVFIGGTGGI